MKTIREIVVLILLVLVNSCSPDEPTNPTDTKSNEANLLKLELEHEGITYTTAISGTSITLSNILPYGTEEVSIKIIETSDKATANKSVGDNLQVSNSPVSIEITAENGTTKKSYSVNLEVEGVPKAEILKLILKGNKTFVTGINNLNISMSEEMHYLNNFVTIEELQLSNGATANKKVGDTLHLPTKTFEIKVTASEPSISNTYALTLRRDEGLQITPNMNLEATSSYKLQISDVYYNADLITDDWPYFSFLGYGDFNNDGNTDVLQAIGKFAFYGHYPIRLFYGNGGAVNNDFCECGGSCQNNQCNGFTEVSNILPNNYEGMEHPRKILPGDYNNDGKLDAFIIAHGYDAEPFPGEAQAILINNGNGFDIKKIENTFIFGHGGSSADIDNDGDLDVFVIGGSKEDAIFLINDGNANFSVRNDLIEGFHFDWGMYTAELIDVNRDGYMDLIIGGHEYEGVVSTIYWGNSYGKYFLQKSISLPTVEGFEIITDIDAEDIDSDGDRDIILARVSSPGQYGFYERYYIQILENKGDNTFLDKSTERISDNEANNWRHWIHLQDLDNDGDIDIYYEENDGQWQGNLKWLNNGQGVFTKVN